MNEAEPRGNSGENPIDSPYVGTHCSRKLADNSYSEYDTRALATRRLANANRLQKCSGGDSNQSQTCSLTLFAVRD